MLSILRQIKMISLILATMLQRMMTKTQLAATPIATLTFRRSQKVQTHMERVPKTIAPNLQQCLGTNLDGYARFSEYRIEGILEILTAYFVLGVRSRGRGILIA